MILAILDALAWAIAVLAAALLAHHVALYPQIVRRWADRRRADAPDPPPLIDDAAAPSISVIAPAHNEEAVIARKVSNLAALDYPTDRIKIEIALDGCVDATEERAVEAVAAAGAADRMKLVVSDANIGKRATLNRAIARADGDLIALTDASAIVGADALRRAARWFADDPSVGVVTGSYALGDARHGEAAYWSYQSRLKTDEAAVAAPMGAHGAFYVVRRDLVEPLEAGVLNDDFVLPMRIVAGGARAVYDPTIVASELEATRPGQDFWRRVRIGAGNMQQALALRSLADPRRGALAFLFASGKGLRAFAPFLLGVGLLCALYLAARGYGLAQLAVLLTALGGAALIATAIPGWTPPALLTKARYFVVGLAASGVGAAQYLWRGRVSRWSAPEPDPSAGPDAFVPMSVRIGKRGLDILCGLAFGAAFLILVVPIAIAIKLDSPGPIFYRQLRVGRAMKDHVRLFKLVKFRSMYIDAEARSGPVWASKDDPRITRVGRFLRKTRLDELPQAVNVLAGDMSFIGPRPERPKFIGKLDEQIPFYKERVLGLKPGVTGLAQVYAGYDETIEDVKTKLLYDHAYAARLSTISDWLRADFEVLSKTVAVVVGRKGQ